MRLRTCSRRCVAQSSLSPTNPALVVFAAVFVLGALFFTLGTILVRAQPRTIVHDEPEVLELWIADVVGTPHALDVAARLDILERLAIVGEAWCVAALQRAATEDQDVSLREAADAALTVVRARTPGSC